MQIQRSLAPYVLHLYVLDADPKGVLRGSLVGA